MDLILNDLSFFIEDNKYKANELMIEFAKTVNEGFKNKFNKVRCEVDPYMIFIAKDYSIKNWLFDNEFKTLNKNYYDFLLGNFTMPYIKEDDEKTQEEFVNNKYFYKNKECYGLAAAYLNNTLSISFNKLEEWKKTKISIFINDEKNEKTVYNVYSEDSFKDKDIKEQIENYGDVILIETKIKIEDKKIHLADHHGKAELKELSNKLKKSPYVVEIISTGFGGNNFIRSANEDGTIEIVLTKYRDKYALLVKTTGRNLRETKKIAEILERNYS